MTYDTPSAERKRKRPQRWRDCASKHDGRSYRKSCTDSQAAVLAGDVIFAAMLRREITR